MFLPNPEETAELEVDAPSLEVEVTEPKVIGCLLGPDGSPLLVMFDRSTVPFGFRRP